MGCFMQSFLMPRSWADPKLEALQLVNSLTRSSDGNSFQRDGITTEVLINRFRMWCRRLLADLMRCSTMSPLAPPSPCAIYAPVLQTLPSRFAPPTYGRRMKHRQTSLTNVPTQPYTKTM